MRVVPPLCNQFIQIIKDTSIVSAIAVGELMHQGKMLSERTAATYEIFFMVGAVLSRHHVARHVRDPRASSAASRSRTEHGPCCPIF